MTKAKQSSAQFSWPFLRRVLVRAGLLFVALNLLFAALYPMRFLGNLSLYNLVFPGRERFPFGENPAKAYNLSLYNLDAMFSSLRLNGAPRPAGEYRVLIVGDSSVWGTLLHPQDTLAGQIASLGLQCGDRRITTYNLGYPTLSATKDLMILDEALRRYQPDRILWLVTLEGLPRELQLASPLLANNAGPARRLINTYHLQLDPAALVTPGFWDRTLVGARRPLADLARLQFYGALWGATGIDQTYPDPYTPAARDQEADPSFHGRQPPSLDAASLALDALSAGASLAAQYNLPLTFINEPILISNGKNSDVRYNFFYPRWAYDQYRTLLTGFMRQNGYSYADFWDLVPEAEFTNSAIHMTPTGERLLSARVADLLQTACQAPAQGSAK
jgi:hypothetical protein